jgi:amylosucrase
MTVNHLDFLREVCEEEGLVPFAKHQGFLDRLMSESHALHDLFFSIYGTSQDSQKAYAGLIKTLIAGYKKRPAAMTARDRVKAEEGAWFTSEQLVGMSLYVDRFSTDLRGLIGELDYLETLGVNALHLLPIMKSPKEASDGGYAVADYRTVDPKFGTNEDLAALQTALQERGMYLMTDIVVNHTSDQHEWAMKAKAGDPYYKEFFYTYPNREVPDAMERAMPEVFPESAPGSFTFVPELQSWVMTVFHNYQWDLNYRNPEVLTTMVDTLLYYGNMGVDILRIDAPAFVWKEVGTTCQNLPQAHQLLQLFKSCVKVAAPGMALLGEAIVSPNQIMDYFGNGLMATRECDLAYNAGQMALQWDALATMDTRNLFLNQHIIARKPLGTTWLNYTRCHDDIGFGFDDCYIEQVGYTPYLHRKFLMDYYSGSFAGSPSKGVLFGVNPKTNDARMSGTLASLCGLETALGKGDAEAIETAVNRIVLMQAQSILLGGIPMLYYGDELGHLNDYSYTNDPSKSYDSRWVHRPVISKEKRQKVFDSTCIESRIFAAHQRLISLRKSSSDFADSNNAQWRETECRSVIGVVRGSFTLFFNYSDQLQQINAADLLAEDVYEELWGGEKIKRANLSHLKLDPYQFLLLRSL